MTNDIVVTENKTENDNNDHEYQFEGVNPLRGILKTQDEQINYDKIIRDRLILLFLTVLSIFIVTPIIIYFIVV
jgi:hypothetical protein